MTSAALLRLSRELAHYPGARLALAQAATRHGEPRLLAALAWDRDEWTLRQDIVRRLVTNGLPTKFLSDLLGVPHVTVARVVDGALRHSRKKPTNSAIRAALEATREANNRKRAGDST